MSKLAVWQNPDSFLAKIAAGVTKSKKHTTAALAGTWIAVSPAPIAVGFVGSENTLGFSLAATTLLWAVTCVGAIDNVDGLKTPIVHKHKIDALTKTLTEHPELAKTYKTDLNTLIAQLTQLTHSINETNRVALTYIGNNQHTTLKKHNFRSCDRTQPFAGPDALCPLAETELKTRYVEEAEATQLLDEKITHLHNRITTHAQLGSTTSQLHFNYHPPDAHELGQEVEEEKQLAQNSKTIIEKMLP